VLLAGGKAVVASLAKPNAIAPISGAIADVSKRIQTPGPGFSSQGDKSLLETVVV